MNEPTAIAKGSAFNKTKLNRYSDFQSVIQIRSVNDEQTFCKFFSRQCRRAACIHSYRKSYKRPDKGTTHQ
jgi:hypothetical protein